MEIVLHRYLRKFAMVYIDDIIIYSNTVEEHLEHLRLVFEALRDANLKVGVSKCELFKDHIEILGHEVK